MNLEKIKKELNPLDIVIFHIGGIGGYGPVDSVIGKFPENVVVVCFEANSSEDDRLVQDNYSKRGVRTVLVSSCLGDTQGKQRFYINKHPESSSLLLPSPQAINEHGVHTSVHTWGENCEVDRVVDIDVTTLDILIENNVLPFPDILSLDAQGAELRIMRGGEKLAMPSALCAVSEIEFFEIYQDQDLFCSQQSFFFNHGFRLAEIFNTQYWHPASSIGLGFLTAGEALFLKDSDKYSDKIKNSKDKSLLYKSIKLTAIAYAFRRFSYCYKITSMILEKYGEEAKLLFLSNKNFKQILDLWQYMHDNQDKYLKDNRFFLKSQWHKKGLAKIKLQMMLYPFACYRRAVINKFQKFFHE
jgi:FkbM family methyltransferase